MSRPKGKLEITVPVKNLYDKYLTSSINPITNQRRGFAWNFQSEGIDLPNFIDPQL